MALVLSPLLNVPRICPGDDVANTVLKGLEDTGILLEDNDILVVTQKIVSKAEGRTIDLSSITPSLAAVELATHTAKDARLVELMIQESTELLRADSKAIICEHKLGFVCPNAGIDQCNISTDNVSSNNLALLLPLNPDRSAAEIRSKIEMRTGKRLGVLIIDSHGRPWRKGSVGTCIGISGVPARVSLGGLEDLFGRVQRSARVAVADELAAAASLVMGQKADGYPIVHVRGFAYPLRESSLKEILRPKEEDSFR